MDAPPTTPTTVTTPTPASSPVAGLEERPQPSTPGFSQRGRMRRRLRFLRRARELAYRDLGGLIFEMHRLSQRRDELVSPKLETLARIEEELRSLEAMLGDRRSVTVLREPGVTACPRCAAIHAGEDRFCPACGLAMSRHADRPIAPLPNVPAALAPAPPPPSPPAAVPEPPTRVVPAAPQPVPEDQPTRAFDPPAADPPTTDTAPSPEEPSGGTQAKP